MSTYSKIKELDMIKYLEKKGATLIVHYGARKLNSGDFLIKYKDITLRCDHKSCHQEVGLSVRIQKSWLPKLIDENKGYPDIPAIPVITLSFFNRRDYYCLIKDSYVKGNPSHETILDPDHWSWVVPIFSLVNTPVICLGVDTLLMNVNVLLQMIDENAINVSAV
jgi:hypothetical protein